MDVYTCDKVGCGATRIVEHAAVGEAFGFHGTVFRVTEFSGTTTIRWFACVDDHIQDAVLGALQRALEEGRA